MNLITQTNFEIDLNRIILEYKDILEKCPWPKGNQIGLRHRNNAKDIWTDAAGSLYDFQENKFFATEREFCNFNPHIGKYTKEALISLSIRERFNIGRVRYMKLPSKKGLSIHRDFEFRYHLALETDKNALFGQVLDEGDIRAVCYNIPADGKFYRVDTNQEHFVYNGSWNDRVHLVICEA